MITEINKKVIVKKAQLKWKIKYLYYSKTLAKLIKTLNSKKELKTVSFLSYINLLQPGREMEQKSAYYTKHIFKKWQGC